MNTDFILHGCNDYEDLLVLINTVKKFKETNDTIIVILDSLNTNDKIIDMVKSFGIEPTFYAHDNWQKKWEFEKTLWQGDLVVNLDADEIPPYLLFKVFRQPFINDPNLEVLAIPRINLYINVTPEKVANMYVGNRPQDFIMQNINALGWSNWPDYQIRIHRPLKHLVWGITTHSGICNYNTLAQLPADPAIALAHAKTIEHVERMCRLYDKLGY